MCIIKRVLIIVFITLPSFAAEPVKMDLNAIYGPELLKIIKDGQVLI